MLSSSFTVNDHVVRDASNAFESKQNFLLSSFAMSSVLNLFDLQHYLLLYLMVCSEFEIAPCRCCTEPNHIVVQSLFVLGDLDLL